MTGRTDLRPLAVVAALGALALVGCRQDMHDNPRIDPLEAHEFWGDGMGSRQIPAGTVARGLLKEDSRYWAGKTEDGAFVSAFPIEVDHDLLEWGQERYEIYCSVCHDSTGNGRGMIVRRGFKQPPSFHEQRLRDLPHGYYFDVITNGFGVMSHYRNQIPTEDRWAIVAYLRALQLSQNAVLAELPPDLREDVRRILDGGGEADAESPEAGAAADGGHS